MLIVYALSSRRYLFTDASRVLEYVQQTWPYWNATGGARHLLLSTSDLGGCEGAQLMKIRGMTQKAIWLTAWGLTRKHPRVWWPGCHRPGLVSRVQEVKWSAGRGAWVGAGRGGAGKAGAGQHCCASTHVCGGLAATAQGW